MALARFHERPWCRPLCSIFQNRQRRFGGVTATALRRSLPPLTFHRPVLIAPSARSPAAVSSANGDHRRLPFRCVTNWSRQSSKILLLQQTLPGVAPGRPAGAPGRQSCYRVQLASL